MFTRKILQANFTLKNGSFSGGGNSLSLNSVDGGENLLRMTADLKANSADSGTHLDNLSIYGMSLSQMNQLSVIGRIYNGTYSQNDIDLYAGEEGGQLSLVFSGNIISAYIDARDMPNVRFVVQAKPDAHAARKIIESNSKQGAYPGEKLVETLAGTMGFKFENNGVNVMLRNPYLWGTASSQVRQVTRAMDCLWCIDRKTLAIWPKSSARKGGSLVVKPPMMVSYPMFQQAQIFVQIYYTDLIPFSDFQVQSDITAANGTWHMSEAHYELDCNMPHGRWFVTLAGLFADAGSGAST